MAKAVQASDSLAAGFLKRRILLHGGCHRLRSIVIAPDGLRRARWGLGGEGHQLGSAQPRWTQNATCRNLQLSESAR